MNLCKVLYDDPHRELHFAPSFGALACSRLLIDDPAQAVQRNDPDDRDDDHRHEQFDERKTRSASHHPLPSGLPSQRGARKPGGGGGSRSPDTV